jgi:eukaryotic-like serine/threonine-protein kinase
VEPIDAGALLDERYRLIERRAAGASATVWAAEDEFLRRRVAVKILHDHLASDADLLARFVDEARTAATVNHPALVAVYDSIRDQPGIVLEWIDGPDLRQRLDKGPIRPEEVAAIGATICDGLAALHTKGLIHRDVKPANILLTTDGRPKLTDFGIATSNAGDRTATGIVLGTAKYLAPEQVQGTPLDGRADVFALAAVLYEALAGRAPWVRDGDLPTAVARLEEDAIDLHRIRADLSPTLVGAVMRGLAREPDRRWPDATAFAAALRGASTLPAPPTRPIIASPPPPTATAQPPRTTTPNPVLTRPRRRRWPRAVGLVILIGIALLGWTLVSTIAGTGSPTTDPTSPGSTDTGFTELGEAVRIVAVEAFDPEGSGTPGEHDERADLAIDGDVSTSWPTERYEARDLGTKSGVGLVLTLDQVTDLTSLTILTEGSDGWAAELYVSTGLTAAQAQGIDDFGEVRGGGSNLPPIADLSLDTRGDTVVIWLTDLGRGDLPIRVAIVEVTIR